jgi:hypothetical protein
MSDNSQKSPHTPHGLNRASSRRASSQKWEWEDGSGSSHTYEIEERVAFSEHINYCLGDNYLLKHIMPLDPDSEDLFMKVHDGLILAEVCVTV